MMTALRPAAATGRATPPPATPPGTPAPAARDGYAGSVPDSAPRFEPRELRQAFGRFPTGVTVVTTGEGDRRSGMTASSFTSVSLDPPLVLFCAMNDSGTLGAIEENGTFAVNVLAEHQADACYAFAGKGDPFAGRETRPGPVTGAPLLPEAIASFECKVWQIAPGGDHKIVIGEIVGLERPAQTAPPMLYSGGKLQSVTGWSAGS